MSQELEKAVERLEQSLEPYGPNWKDDDIRLVLAALAAYKRECEACRAWDVEHADTIGNDVVHIWQAVLTARAATDEVK